MTADDGNCSFAGGKRIVFLNQKELFPHWSGDFFGELEFIWNADRKVIRIRLDADDFTKWPAKQNKPANFHFYFSFEWSLEKYNSSLSTTNLFLTIEALADMLKFVSSIIDIHEKFVITYFARETSFSVLWEKIYWKYIKLIFIKNFGYQTILQSMIEKKEVSILLKRQ